MERITISTSLPVIPSNAANRPPILTTRLLLRPLFTNDLNGLHAIRSQEEVMTWTTQGVPALNLKEMEHYLAERLRSEVRFDYAICLREGGEMIGFGGVTRMAGQLGWPNMGYIFRKEAWGQGYATEFVRGFLPVWWSLERRPCEIEVDVSTIRGDGDVKEEVLLGGVIKGNAASDNILRKTGFRLVKVYEQALRDYGPPLTIPDYTATKQDLKY